VPHPKPSDYVRSLGWFIRFAPPERRDALNAFYLDVLGLPFLRGGTGQKVDMYWAGEALVTEVIWEFRGASYDPLDSHPDTAQTMPFDRVSGLDALVARLESRGARVLRLPDADGYRQAAVLEPDVGVVGLRELQGAPVRAQDVEAARRRARGEAFNPGCATMPEGWQELGWVRHRVHDLPAMQRFYATVLDVPVIDATSARAWLDLGDNSILELVPGGRVVPLPANRSELTAVFILRVQQREALKERARAAGGAVVHELIQWDRGELSYLADPEGHLIGIEERYHPSRYAPRHVCFPEDVEARRRRAEAVHAAKE
jgi:predicted enzyme related to lactoylglutathione lyase